MPIDPRRYALTPEGRTADRLADLERRVGRREAGSIRGRQYAEALGEVSTTLDTPTDLGGPTITVTVDPGYFIAVFFEVELKSTSSDTSTAAARVSLFEATDIPSGDETLVSRSSEIGPGVPQPYERWRTTSGAGTSGIFGGRMVYPPTVGERTYQCRYAVLSGGTAWFRNRKLWIEVL